jgi:hypothetical protein
MTLDEYQERVSHINFVLNAGVGKLLMDRYRPHFGIEYKFLAASVVNFAMLREAANDDARRYMRENQVLIEQQAQLLRHDRKVISALTDLYSFTLFSLALSAPETSKALVNRAIELGIWLEAPREVCCSEDISRYLDIMQTQAEKLWDPEDGSPSTA